MPLFFSFNYLGEESVSISGFLGFFNVCFYQRKGDKLVIAKQFSKLFSFLPRYQRRTINVLRW